MAEYSKEEVLKAIEEAGMVPVFYHPDVHVCMHVLRSCYAAGVRVFEFTNRGENAAYIFKELVEYVDDVLPGLILGIGSISYGKDARKFIKLGANFVVSPQFVPDAVRICKWHKVPYIPGCGTISEVGRAQRAGCEITKIFPGDVLGPAFVKALRAPMPWSKVMVTGGVKPTMENLGAWFKAGVTCVGMGSNLFPKEVLEAEEWDTIIKLCYDAMKIIAIVR